MKYFQKGMSNWKMYSTIGVESYMTLWYKYKDGAHGWKRKPVQLTLKVVGGRRIFTAY